MSDDGERALAHAHPPGGTKFVTTRWSLVVAAGGGSDSRGRDALEELLGVYWRPVYAYLRRTGHDVESAKDATQGFFTDMIARAGISRADASLGRFRSFLLVSLKNYLSNQRDRQNTEKRGGGTPHLAMEFQTEEGWLSLEPAHEQTPERLFEHRWAMTLLERVTQRLRTEREGREDPDRFQRLSELMVSGEAEHSYAAAGAQLGMSADSVKSAVYRLRRRFARLLREEIAETVETPEEVEEELRFLLQALEG